MTVAHSGPTIAVEGVDAAATWMRGQGHRVSAARRLVLEALFAADAPISAEQIAEGLDGKLPLSDPASVYRNLETLERLGLVRHFHAGHGPGLYALAREQEYVSCSSCGEVRALDGARFDGIRDLIRIKLGVTARFDHFPIVGVCDRCIQSHQDEEKDE